MKKKTTVLGIFEGIGSFFISIFTFIERLLDFIFSYIGKFFKAK